MYIRYFCIKRFMVNLIGRHIGCFRENFFAVIRNRNFAAFECSRNIKAEIKTVFSRLNIYRRVNSCVLNLPYFADRVPILLKLPCFVRRNPSKIGLIIGINAGHKLYIRSVFIGKVRTPHIAEIAYAPMPHFFTGRNMMVCNGSYTLIYSGIIARNKVHIGLTLRNQVRRRHFNRVIVR